MLGIPPQTARKAHRTNAWTHFGIAFVVATLGLLLVATPTSADTVDLEEALDVSPSLVDELEAAGSMETVEAIVMMEDRVHEEDIQAALDHGLQFAPPLDALPVFMVRGTPADIEAFLLAEDVVAAEWNQPLDLLLDTDRLSTRAESVTGHQAGIGGPLTLGSDTVDGDGVGVAIVDSGIDATHPDLPLEDKVVKNLKFICASPGLINTNNERCFANTLAGPSVPPDATRIDEGCNAGESRSDPEYAELWIESENSDTSSGHGTHVAGIAAGTGAASDGTYHGVAPGASLYGLGIGEGISMFATLEAFDWVYCNHDDVTPNIKIINNSWGIEGCNLAPAGPIAHDMLQALTDQDITIIFSAGNDGGDGGQNCTSTFAQTGVPGVISVANYDDLNAGLFNSTLNPGSSRGLDGAPETYPDVSAPGTMTTAPLATTSTATATGIDSEDPLNYTRISGTSMAAPHAAGVAALMLQANGDLTPSQVESILKGTAEKVQPLDQDGDPIGAAYDQDGASFDKGHGLVNARAAVQEAATLASQPLGDTLPAAAQDASSTSVYLATEPTGLQNVDEDGDPWKDDAPTETVPGAWTDHVLLTNDDRFWWTASYHQPAIEIPEDDPQDVTFRFWADAALSDGGFTDFYQVTLIAGGLVHDAQVQPVNNEAPRLYEVTLEDVSGVDNGIGIRIDCAFADSCQGNTLLYDSLMFPSSLSIGDDPVEPQDPSVSPEDVCITSRTPPDCFETIQEAIDAATEGETITVGAGTYEEAVTLDKALTLATAAGQTQTTVQAPPDGVPLTATAGATVTGFTFELTNPLETQPLVDAAGPVTLENNDLTTPNGVALLLNHEDATAVGNILQGTTTVEMAQPATLQDNMIGGAQGTGLLVTTTSQAPLVEGNEFAGNAIHILDEGSKLDLRSTLVTNTFDQATAVADDAQLVAGIFSEIQPAIDDASQDQQVLAAPGTYDESLTIETPGLTVCHANHNYTDCRLPQDTGSERPTIQAPFGSEVGIRIQADDVTVAGLTVEVPTQAGTGIDATGADAVTLTNNDINVGIPDGEFGLQAAMNPQQADYWLNPFVEEILAGDTLATITDQRADDEGFLGAQPAHEPQEHIALLYRSQAPAEAHQMVEASKDPVLRIYEGIEPTPLIENLGHDGFYTVSQDHELEGPLTPSPVEGIGPGTSLQISRPDGTFGCTANFVFQDDAGQAYLGTAGHCVLPEGISSFEDPNWRQEDISVSYCEQPLFTTVARACWATGALGDVAFAMQDDGAGTQFGFDFALIEIPDHYIDETPDYCDEALHEHCGQVRPWMPVWGGPTGETIPVVGDAAVHYGHGVGVGATFPTEARAGVTIFQDGISFDALGWVTGGDSGSGISTAADRTDQMLVGDEAFGDITHSIVVVGAPLMTGTTVEQGMNLAQQVAGVDVDLVLENDELQTPGIDAPLPPEGVEVLDVSTFEEAILDVSWELPEDSPPADAYDVYLEDATDPLAENVTRTSYQDLEATDGQERCYEIVAKNDGGQSGRSQTACGTPTQPDLPPPAFVHVLDRGNGDEVAVIWGAPEASFAFDGYRIERTAPGEDAIVTNVGPDTQAFVDGSLDEGVEYTYEVRVVQGQDTSDPVLDAAVATTSAPTWAQAQGAPSGVAYTGAAGTITAPGLQDSLPLSSESTAPPLAEDLTGDGSIEILIVENMEDANDDIVVRALSFEDGTLEETWSHTIARAQPFDGPPTEGFGTAAIGDLTGDGDLEVAVYTNHILNLQAVTGNAGKLTVLDGATGDALDSDADSITIGTDIAPRLVDLNGDGTQEIVFIQQVGGAEPGYYLQAQAVTDDGDLQLLFDELVTPDAVHAPPALLTQEGGATSFALGDDTGDVLSCEVEDEGSWSVDCSTLTNLGSAVRGISQGHMEAAEQPTVVAHTSNGNVATITLDPDGTTASLDVAEGLWTPPSVADLDGDAFTEIASAPANGFIDDTEQRGDVSFSGIVDGALTELGVLERVPSDTSAHAPGGALVADITGDGALDVLVGDEDGRIVAIAPDLANGGPVLEWALPVGGSITAPLAVADVTGDGALSIVAIAGDELVVVDSVIDTPAKLIGIDMEGASDALVQNNVLHASGEDAGSIGIQASGASVPNVVIDANTIEAGDATLVLNDAPGATVSNNDITKLSEGPGYGINIAGDDVSIVHNDLTSTFDNSEHVADPVDGFETVNQFALRISGDSDNPTVVGNTIQNWANMGIIVTGNAGDEGLIHANTFDAIRWHGISLEGPDADTTIEVLENSFQNSYRGVSLSGLNPDALELRQNTFAPTLVEALRVSGAHEDDVIDARLNAWGVVGEAAIQTRVNDESGTNEVLVKPYLDAVGNAHPPLPEVRCDKGDGFQLVAETLSLQEAIDLELPAACGPFQGIDGYRQVLLGASHEHYDPATATNPATITQNPSTAGVDQRLTATPTATIQATDQPALNLADGSEGSRVLHLTLASNGDTPGILVGADDVRLDQNTFLGDGTGLVATDQERVAIEDNLFRMGGSQQSALTLANVTDASVKANLVNANQLPGSIGIEFTDSEDPALADNVVIDARIGLRLADTTGATLEDNIVYLAPGIPGFGGIASGMVLFGGHDHAIERSLLAGVDEGIVVHGASDVHVNMTRILGADTGIRLDASFTDAQPTGFSANNTNLALTATPLALTDATRLLNADATCVNWGVYHASLIEQRIDDGGFNNDVTYDPWTSANQNDPAASCLTPPEASFDHTVDFDEASADDEDTITRLDTITFEDGSEAGTRDIVEWRWDLGDGTNETATPVEDPDVTHSYDALGTFPIVLTVEDADGMIDHAVQEVTIENLAPELEAPDDQEIHHTEDVSVPVVATSPEGDDISLSVEDGPSGVGLDDHGDGTGTLTWDPAPEQFGQHGIVITATDAHEGTDTTTVTVDVENLAPELEAPDQVPGALERTLTFDILAQSPDEDPIDLDVDLAALPDGHTATLETKDTEGHTAEATFTWTPTSTEAIGDHEVPITVESPGHAVTQTVLLDIRDQVPPPDLTLTAPGEAPEGATLSVDAHADVDPEAQNDVVAWDANTKALVDGDEALVEGTLTTDANNATWTGTIPLGADEVTVTFTADDGLGATSASTTTLAQLHPEVSALRILEESTGMFTLDPVHAVTPLTLRADAVDEDGAVQTLTATITPQGESATEETVLDLTQEQGTLWTATTAPGETAYEEAFPAPGDYDVVYTATDDDGLPTATLEQVITLQQHQPPTVSMPSQERFSPAQNGDGAHVLLRAFPDDPNNRPLNPVEWYRVTGPGLASGEEEHVATGEQIETTAPLGVSTYEARATDTFGAEGQGTMTTFIWGTVHMDAALDGAEEIDEDTYRYDAQATPLEAIEGTATLENEAGGAAENAVVFVEATYHGLNARDEDVPLVNMDNVDVSIEQGITYANTTTTTDASGQATFELDQTLSLAGEDLAGMPGYHEITLDARWIDTRPSAPTSNDHASVPDTLITTHTLHVWIGPSGVETLGTSAAGGFS